MLPALTKLADRDLVVVERCLATVFWRTADEQAERTARIRVRNLRRCHRLPIDEPGKRRAEARDLDLVRPVMLDPRRRARIARHPHRAAIHDEETIVTTIRDREEDKVVFVDVAEDDPHVDIT